MGFFHIDLSLIRQSENEGFLKFFLVLLLYNRRTKKALILPSATNLYESGFSAMDAINMQSQN